MTEATIEEEYTDTLSQLGKEVFKEFLGELSRKRQANLLVSSAVTILLTFAIVEPVESQFAGIKFEFSNVDIIPTIAAILCGYFLITYLVSALQDWQLEKYRTLPARTALGNLLQQFEAIFGQQADDLTKRAAGIKERENILAKARVELDNKKDEIEDQLEILRKRHASALTRMEKKGTSPEKLELLRKKQLMEQWKLMLSILDVPELVSVLIYKDDEDENEAYYDEMGEKSRALEKAVYRYIFFRNINVLIEIVFPTILALFAIGSAIWKITS